MQTRTLTPLGDASFALLPSEHRSAGAEAFVDGPDDTPLTAGLAPGADMIGPAGPATLGIVVGDHDTLAIDTGLNHQVFTQLTTGAQMAARTVGGPETVSRAVNTSHQAGQCYANGYLAPEVELIQSDETQAYLDTWYSDDVRFLRSVFGADAGIDNAPYRPADRLLTADSVGRLDLGGRTVEIYALPTVPVEYGEATTTGLAVWVPGDRVLFAGPPISLTGAMMADPTSETSPLERLATCHTHLTRLRALTTPEATIVPNGGRPIGADALDRQIRAVEDLLVRGVAQHQGATLERAGAGMAAAPA
jgi:glyoxylase-like metal-dependent hydrolase (beta-lactamase superfamily II)